jgi:hypothetical protein
MIQLWNISEDMILNAFPILIGVLVNLRELSVNDAQAIANL